MFDSLSAPQVKQGLGGRVRLILSGAAPLATHVEAYLRVVACCYVLQGYGICPKFLACIISMELEYLFFLLLYLENI